MRYVLAFLLSFPAYATTFESAELGPTGQATAGVIIASTQYVGWRFDVSTPLVVTQIGGHLTTLRGTIFGAIVGLDQTTGFPTFPPSELGSKAVAGTRFDSGGPSKEVRVDLSAELTPGSYALIYGGGDADVQLPIVDPSKAPFGATGAGRMPGDNIPIPGASDPARFFFANPSDIWINMVPGSSNSTFRFVVEARAVPEPSVATCTIVLMLLGLLARKMRR